MLNAAVARGALSNNVPLDTPGVDRERVLSAVAVNIKGAEAMLAHAITAGVDNFPLYLRRDASEDVVSYLASVGETRRQLEALGYVVDMSKDDGNHRFTVNIPPLSEAS